MNGPLLYHVLNNLLHKGELVDAYFVMHRYGSHPLSGVVQSVKLNSDGWLVIYVRHGANIEFRTLDESDTELLHLQKDKHGVWLLGNVPKKEELDEGALDEAVDPEAPITVHLVQNLLKKGERVELRWFGAHGQIIGKILEIEYTIVNDKRSLVEIMYKADYHDAPQRTDFGRDVFEAFDLVKKPDSWWLIGKN